MRNNWIGPISTLTLAIGLACSTTQATPIDDAASLQAAEPPLFSVEEAEMHKRRMQGMSDEQRARYRDDQWEILKRRAEARGYQMPDNPPWADTGPTATPDTKEATAITPTTEEPVTNEAAVEEPAAIPGAPHAAELQAFRARNQEIRQQMAQRRAEQLRRIQDMQRQQYQQWQRQMQRPPMPYYPPAPYRY